MWYCDTQCFETACVWVRFGKNCTRFMHEATYSLLLSFSA